MGIIEIVLTALLTGGTLGFVQFLIQRHDLKKSTIYVSKKDIDPIKDGILAILQERLESMMTKYISDGEITPTQFKTLETLLKAYENLGGDGFIHALFDQCKELM